MFLNKSKTGRRALSVMLVAAMFSSVAATSVVTTSAASVTTEASSSYGLVDNVQDGQILQCWNWSYNGIKNNMKTIAEQGFSAIQTSPIQTIKESTQGKTFQGSWWVYYQPAHFKIDTASQNALGTKSDFEAMCAEAHKYGVKVIVDAVLNHMANDGDNTLSSTLPSDIKNDSSCWYSITTNTSNWTNRYDITHNCMGGLPDLNTSNSKIQNYELTFMKECIDAGADGFRFDGAKHIEVPNDNDGASSNFWSVIVDGTTSYAKSTRNITPYYYGEILDNTGGGQNVLNEYTKYMSVTLNGVGNDIRNQVNSGNGSAASRSDFTYSDGSAPAPTKAVLWNESHDTYADGSSRNVSDKVVNQTWAIVGSRAQSCGMYLARPASYSQSIGTASVSAWSNAEVKAVNQFKNYFVGQSEYLSSSGAIAYNERGTSGAVIVNCAGGSTSVSVKANKMKDGTYKDQVSGNTFTVSGGQIKGQIGSTGIAVVYNAVPQSGISATPGTQGGTYSYKTDTLSVKLNATNVTNAKYSLDGGAATSFTDGQTVTIGSGKEFETTQTLTLTATNASGAAVTATYTFYKTNQGTTIYFDNSAYNWSNVYAYVYTGDGEAAQAVQAWPGVQLTNKSAKTGYYYYDLPSGYESASVIFSDGVDGTSNRYPADMQPGLSIGGASHLFTSGNTWKEYKEVNDNPTEPTETPTSPLISGESYYKGDADGNNKVNLKDSSVIQKALVGLTTLSDKGKKAADVNGDGDLTLIDVLSVMRYLVGMQNTYNIGSLVQGSTPIDPTNPPTPTDPPTSVPVGNNILVFNDSAIAVGNERYCVYVWDGNGGEQFINMTSVGANKYQVSIPDGYSNVIIMRMNGESTDNNWDNCWNQTDDLTFSSSQNMFTATGWGSDNKFTVNGSSIGDNPIDPPVDPPVSSNTLYFNDSAIVTGLERYCVYAWDGNGGEQFINMTSAGSNLYQATIPDGYSNVIIMRMNGETTDNNWDNCWNQTDDLTFSSSQNMFTATGWGSGNKFNVTGSKR